MEENILTCLENFDVLWRRVSPGSFLSPAAPSAPQEPSGMLADLWADFLDLARSYHCLAALFTGAARTLLLHHAEESHRQARRLKAEYFLRCGDCPRFIAPSADGRGRLTRLRRLYLKEKALAGALMQAARADSDPEFSENLSTFSKAAEKRAEENRQLLLRCF